MHLNYPLLTFSLIMEVAFLRVLVSMRLEVSTSIFKAWTAYIGPKYLRCQPCISLKLMRLVCMHKYIYTFTYVYIYNVTPD